MLRLLTRPLIKPPSISTTLRLPFRNMATINTPEFVCFSNTILCLVADFDNRTKFCINHWQKSTPKSRISLTRRHGGSLLVWNSSRQRLEYVLSNFRCHLITHNPRRIWRVRPPWRPMAPFWPTSTQKAFLTLVITVAMNTLTNWKSYVVDVHSMLSTWTLLNGVSTSNLIPVAWVISTVSSIALFNNRFLYFLDSQVCSDIAQSCSPTHCSQALQLLPLWFNRTTVLWALDFQMVAILPMDTMSVAKPLSLGSAMMAYYSIWSFLTDCQKENDCIFNLLPVFSLRHHSWN